MAEVVEYELDSTVTSWSARPVLASCWARLGAQGGAVVVGGAVDGGAETAAAEVEVDGSAATAAEAAAEVGESTGAVVEDDVAASDVGGVDEGGEEL